MICENIWSIRRTMCGEEGRERLTKVSVARGRGEKEINRININIRSDGAHKMYDVIIWKIFNPLNSDHGKLTVKTIQTE